MGWNDPVNYKVNNHSHIRSVHQPLLFIHAPKKKMNIKDNQELISERLVANLKPSLVHVQSKE